MTIGNRIKNRRIELNLTQDELARKCGYKSRSSINKIELSRELPLRKIEIMARALDCSPSYLMGWEDDTKSIIAETDWLEMGLSLIGWKEKEELRDNNNYETTLTDGERSLLVSANDIEKITESLKMYLLDMLTGARRENHASPALDDQEMLLLRGFHAASDDIKHTLLMIARDAVGSQSGASETSTSSRDEATA